ncbi:MAG: ATP-dependent DNA helicase [Candidatus Nanoarchaeia archaeon]
MELTREQSKAIELASEAIRYKEDLFKLGGYAGTGKTTVSRYVMDKLGDLEALACAFTGKAALRLREKGIEKARTIHSLIYDYDSYEKKFHLKNNIFGDYFLIDEASMLNHILWRDILKFHKPVLLVGDPGQLEPIGDDPGLMKTPDFVLSQIHRQAKDNGIIQFATDIRNKENIKNNYKNVEIKDYFSYEDLDIADIIICGYNSTRCEINKKIREIKGYDEILNNGEQIIVLKNDSRIGVFNGQLLTIEKIIEECENSIYARCSDSEDEILELNLNKNQFGKLKLEEDKKQRNIVYADYGYCITAHKSQGSEWNNVLVIDQQCKLWDAHRWRYTAITRASKNLTYIINNPLD